MNIKQFFGVIVLLVLSISAQAATIHLILVYETEDTGIGAQVDAALMKAQVRNIAQITNMAVEVHAFDRRDGRVAGFVTDFRADADDVVWFHYSGHGANAGDGWPQYTDGAARFPQTDIHEILQRCGARLCITMFDACNIGATEEAWSRTTGMPGNQLNLLFRKASGDILIASASDARYSWGSPDIGGFATASLVQAMNQVPVTPQDSPRSLWNKVLLKMQRETDGMCQSIRKEPQHPKWDLNLDHDPDNDQEADIHNTPERRVDMRRLGNAFGRS
jgi:hypothetical protein